MVMGNVLIPKNEVKGVTTKGGKMTAEATPSKEINKTGINKNEPPKYEHDVQEKPHDVGVKNKSSSLVTKDDECYGIDDLDDTINIETQELLENDQLDSFLLKDLEKSVNRSHLESCNSIGDKFFQNFDIEMSIWRIDPVSTLYSEAQETEGTDRVKNEHLYLASANEIDEKKPVLKYFPSHFEYAYLHGFFQIPIALEDQEKTTFTCPYETFSYMRMLFGLCNVPATFQRSMTAIFHDMVEDFMEVFMDDFSADFVNYITGKVVPPKLDLGKKKELNELAELRDGAYENTRIYKERTKKWHDSRLRGDKDFKVADKVLLYNSHPKMYPRKLKSK
nr:RNA-directed DNA polymerase homolog [Tanacetum cinerariifolium]